MVRPETTDLADPAGRTLNRTGDLRTSLRDPDHPRLLQAVLGKRRGSFIPVLQGKEYLYLAVSGRRRVESDPDLAAEREGAELWSAYIGCGGSSCHEDYKV